MKVVGVVCALGAEARQLGRTTARPDGLGVLTDGTLLALSGMGCTAAAAGARALVDAGATALISWGMAGGLDPSLTPGTIVVPTEILAADGRAIATTLAWQQQCRTALAGPRPTAGGRLLTSARAIGSVAEKAALFRQLGARAVDMESLAIAEVALARSLPFVAVRVIVDGAADILPRTVTAAADVTGRLQLARLLAAVALAPMELAALIRLARRYWLACRSLRAAAEVAPWSCSGYPTAPSAVPP